MGKIWQNARLWAVIGVTTIGWIVVVFMLRLGPVILTLPLGGSHGIHLGDLLGVLFLAIAGLVCYYLADWYGILAEGFVLLAVSGIALAMVK